MTRLITIEDNLAHKDQLLRVEWNLGKRCNFDCSYCSGSIHDKTSPHLEMSVIEKTLSRLAQLGREQGKEVKLAFTGGEPFLHPDFIDILERAKELGIERMSVTTNGSLQASLYLKAIPILSHLIISYHMEYAKRGKVLENIEALHDLILQGRDNNPWQGLHVHVMLLPGAFAEAEEVVSRLKARGIQYAVRRIRPQFDAEGEYLAPFHSGQLGRPKSAVGKASRPYYAAEELQRMEAGF